MIRGFQQRRQKEAADNEISVTIRKGANEEDEVTTALRQAMNAPVPVETEERMRKSLMEFRGKLEKHPYVARLEGRGIWRWFDLREALGGGLAAAAVLLVVTGMSTLMPALGALMENSFGETAVAGVGVGDLRLGTAADQVEVVWGKPGEVSPGLISYFDRGIQVHVGAGGLVREIACHKAGVVPGPFRDFRGSTPEGIKIGTSEAEVVKTMGEPQQKLEEPGARESVTALRYNSGIEFAVRGGSSRYQSSAATVCTIKVMPAGTVLSKALRAYVRGTALQDG